MAFYIWDVGTHSLYPWGVFSANPRGYKRTAPPWRWQDKEGEHRILSEIKHTNVNYGCEIAMANVFCISFFKAQHRNIWEIEMAHWRQEKGSPALSPTPCTSLPLYQLASGTWKIVLDMLSTWACWGNQIRFPSRGSKKLTERFWKADNLFTRS